MRNFFGLLLLLIFLSGCSIDWNNEKEKQILELNDKIKELENKNNIEKEKLEFEKEKYEEEKVMKKESEIKKEYEKYYSECKKIYDDNNDKFIDFINTCTGKGGNSVDFCIGSPAGIKFTTELINKDFIDNCIENRKSKSY